MGMTGNGNSRSPLIWMLDLEENVGDHLDQGEKKGGEMLGVRDLERLLAARNLNEDVGDHLHQ